MEFAVYIITHIILLACLLSIVYVIATPERNLSDHSDIW